MGEWVFEASKKILFFVIWNPGTDMEGRILLYLYRAMTRMIAIVIDAEHSHLHLPFKLPLSCPKETR